MVALRQALLVARQKENRKSGSGSRGLGTDLATILESTFVRGFFLPLGTISNEKSLAWLTKQASTTGAQKPRAFQGQSHRTDPEKNTKNV